ncbi:DUF350 domain-containing protein [Massilia sp. TS11]|uniref:DUF350 domain-containing protein n=1 Tax=Massilia sp. TS11 TaxID=2908003 RepID=UPI001EDC8DA9|nr:DUF350 domain-containing protein [Massilia sp. TS11]MCG2585689.1 DUF350 domain-containing protein [Massilia sp. TS11]
MDAILNYLLHLLLSAGLVAAFFWIYTGITPFKEVALIRGGNMAAALSLSGAVLGFAVTLASALMHTPDYRQFLLWAALALIVQLACYFVATRLLHMAQDQIEANNKAFGTLLGGISLSIGLINAGCIS